MVISDVKVYLRYKDDTHPVKKIITSKDGKLIQMIARYQAKEQCHCNWSKKGTPISESQNVKVFHEKINARSYEYRVEIHRPNKDAAGLYKCQVKNGNGQMQVYLHLDIKTGSSLAKRRTKDAPTFYDTPKIISLNNGKLIEI